MRQNKWVDVCKTVKIEIRVEGQIKSTFNSKSVIRKLTSFSANSQSFSEPSVSFETYFDIFMKFAVSEKLLNLTHHWTNSHKNFHFHERTNPKVTHSRGLSV